MRITKQDKTKRLENLSNSEIEALIDTWIRGELNRKILKLRLIDEICLEPLADMVGLSVQQTKARLYRAEDRFFAHIPKSN